MTKKHTPTEIARKTLLELTKVGLPPTPENYARVYEEITGPSQAKSASLSSTLQKVLAVLGKKDAKFLASSNALNKAIKKQDWPSVEQQITKLFLKSSAASSDNTNWASLIRTLLKQLETSHKGITLSRKKEGLTRVLINFSKDPLMLEIKLQALMRSWGESSSHKLSDATESQTNLPANLNTPQLAKDASEEAKQLRSMLIRTIDLALIPILQYAPDSQKKAEALLQKLRQQHVNENLSLNEQELKSILFIIETEQENQQNINQTMINLLNLTAKSMEEMLVDDGWLTSQITVVKDVLNKKVSLVSLQNAEASLKELIHKQSNLKPAMQESKDLMKQMAETFITRLVDVTESTDEYHAKIENHQKQLNDIKGIDDLNGILKSVLDDTRNIGLTVHRTRDEFIQSQTKVEEAEKKIQELTSVLEYINEVANEDYLTGTLNRRGMDEALEREFNRADRHHTALSIAMMDIDHFKKLNDSLGHKTGDEALAHFAKVIKNVKRSTDVLARYGGEEFIIILPNTVESDAISVIERVQRALTKQFFMHSNEKVVITFSGGVAQRMPEETPDAIIPRADAALYEAKNAGRNRVIGAQSISGQATSVLPDKQTEISSTKPTP